MNKKYSVDRIEGEYALLVNDDTVIEVLLSDFGFEVKEGMILTENPDGGYLYDEDETSRIKKELFEKQNSLFCTPN